MQDKKYFIVCNPTQEPNREKMRYCTLKEQLKNLCVVFETQEQAEKYLIKKGYSEKQASKTAESVYSSHFADWHNI